MILITGATGFVGLRLANRLVVEANLQIRVLVRPGTPSSQFPEGISIHPLSGDIHDSASLDGAMEGIHTVFHLIGTDTRGRSARFDEVDIAGTKAVIKAALAARVGRIIYVSRVGASRASAFPILQMKGEIEELLRKSGLAYTIFHTSVLFGEGDRFSENLAMLIRPMPLFFIPGDGEMVIQPLWVEDLVTCMIMALEDLDTIDRKLIIGGPELLSYRRIVMRVMHTIHSRRPIISLPLLLHQAGAWFLDGLFARWPYTQQWVEMLSTNQTADMGSIERHFGFRPTSFDIGLLSQYLRRRYTWELIKYIFTTRW